MQGFVAEGNGRFLLGVADSLSWAERGGGKRAMTQAVLAAPPRPQDGVPLTTLAFFSAFVCLTQRSCVSGRTVEMALEGESLLLLHVAPCSFNPGKRKSNQRSGNSPGTHRPRAQLCCRHPAPSTPLCGCRRGLETEAKTPGLGLHTLTHP